MHKHGQARVYGLSRKAPAPDTRHRGRVWKGALVDTQLYAKLRFRCGLPAEVLDCLCEALIRPWDVYDLNPGRTSLWDKQVYKRCLKVALDIEKAAVAASGSKLKKRPREATP